MLRTLKPFSTVILLLQHSHTSAHLLSLYVVSSIYQHIGDTHRMQKAPNPAYTEITRKSPGNPRIALTDRRFHGPIAEISVHRTDQPLVPSSIANNSVHRTDQ